jgi:cellulose synthase/poly-beta-1,6-N-acetylglucosamine synthase-like glycosyltransferase
MLGASGAIYAIRRSQFVHPSRPVINDDLVLPMLIHLRHGCRVIYDESARATVRNAGGLIGEFRRRCRIGAGAFQCLPVLYELLRWRNAKQALAFVSHKLLRWIGPFLLVASMITSISLAREPAYRVLMQLQLVGYLLAIVGLFIRGQGVATRTARIASSFLLMNLALLIGFVRWAWNPSQVVWNPTSRVSSPRPETQQVL